MCTACLLAWSRMWLWCWAGCSAMSWWIVWRCGMRNNGLSGVGQLSLLGEPPCGVPLEGQELEVEMRRVWLRWRRWHPCCSFEAAVQDTVTRRLLELAARRGHRG